MESTILGMLIGGIFRIAPELLKTLNLWLENKHELEMLDKSKESPSPTPSSNTMSRSFLPTENIELSFIDRLIQVQDKKTGNKFLDFMNIMVRPGTTFTLVMLYVGIKIYFVVAFPGLLITEAYTTEDMALLGGILNFWFLGRVFDKK